MSTNLVEMKHLPIAKIKFGASSLSTRVYLVSDDQQQHFVLLHSRDVPRETSWRRNQRRQLRGSRQQRPLEQQQQLRQQPHRRCWARNRLDTTTQNSRTWTWPAQGADFEQPESKNRSDGSSQARKPWNQPLKELARSIFCYPRVVSWTSARIWWLCPFDWCAVPASVPNLKSLNPFCWVGRCPFSPNY